MHLINTLARMRADRSARQAARFRALRRPAVTLAASLLAVGALAGPAVASPAPPDASANYSYMKVNNNTDPTFNQLLGINDSGLIAGLLRLRRGWAPQPRLPRLGSLRSGPFQQRELPPAAQTQVTGLNNTGATVGFFVDTARRPAGLPLLPPPLPHGQLPDGQPGQARRRSAARRQRQGVAVGFYTDAKGVNHGYVYNIHTTTSTCSRRPGTPAPRQPGSTT